MIYPGIYMDKKSAQSLASYERWYHERQDPTRKKSMDEQGFAAPPPIHVASVEFTMAMVFSDRQTKTLVSMCGVPRYVGKWVTDVPANSQQPIRGLAERIMRRLKQQGRWTRNKDGY